MPTWMQRVERWLAQTDAWFQRMTDRYECFLERRVPWASRRRYVDFLRCSADETEHFRPRGAVRDRRRAAELEREGLEVSFRMDQGDGASNPR